MTAIEWLEEQLEGTVFYTPEAKQNIFEQAKEMEKQQIRCAIHEANKSNNRNVSLNSEQYYNETFKKK